MNYDLEGRTSCFSKRVISFLGGVKTNDINRSIVLQLLKSSTSIGANYREANGAVSKKDFFNKIAICRKEARETEYWLELLAATDDGVKDPLRCFWKEAHELVLIFGKISGSFKK